MIDQILPIVIDYKSSKKQSINEGLKGFDSFNKKLPFGPFFQSIIDSINPIRLKEAHFPVPNPNPNRFPIQSNRFGPPPIGFWTPQSVLDPPIDSNWFNQSIWGGSNSIPIDLGGSKPGFEPFWPPFGGVKKARCGRKIRLFPYL